MAADSAVVSIMAITSACGSASSGLGAGIIGFGIGASPAGNGMFSA
jgi:hypothetical protein